MGVYIPDMELPSSCLFCDIPVRVQPCPVDHDNVSNYKTSRHPACPFIPVPPHGRLIDASALFEEVYKVWGTEYDASECNSLMGFINEAPTIIPAEPAEEAEE